MKIEDFKKTKDELNMNKAENDKLVRTNYERTRMANVNQLDYKLGNILAFAMLPYFGLTFGVMGLSSLIGASTLASIIPPLSIPTILASCSLGIGIIGRKLTEKKYKTKERIKAFSKAKTEAEKVEEEIYYQIELEKAKNRNQIVQQTISSLDSNEALLRSFSSKYDINEKNASQTEQEAKQRLEELSAILEQKYKELDILTTQKVLSESFWRLRCKGQKGMDLTLVFMGGGMMTMMVHSTPLMVMREVLTYNSVFASFVPTLLPLVIGSVGVGSYWINRNKNRERAFNNLNDTLGEKSLPKKVSSTYDETQELKSMIERKISDISIVEIQLKEQQRTLETITSQQTKTNDNSKDMEKAIPLFTEEEIRLYQQESPAPFNPETIFGSSEIVEETQHQEKGPTLVKRRKPTNQTDKK